MYSLIKNSLQSKMLQIKVELLGVQPSIWRRLQVPADITFLELHDVLQTGMGWQNRHPFAFALPDRLLVIREEDGDSLNRDLPLEDAAITKILPLLETGQSYLYLYDFTDGWKHSLTIEKQFLAEEGKTYPVCTTGRRRCPPEDVGGPKGYDKLLELLSDPTDLAYLQNMLWATGDKDEEYFDAEAWDRRAVNRALKQMELPSAEPYPQREEWLALFKVAQTVGALQPWKQLADNEMIQIQPKDSQSVYCVTMGKDGGCQAVAFYFGDNALWSLEQMYTGKAHPILQKLGMQDCLICYFCDRQQLSEDDYNLLKDLGLRIRGKGQWIFFRSMRPGRFPWYVQQTEAKALTDCLGWYVQAVQCLHSGAVEVDFAKGEWLTYRQTQEAEWTALATKRQRAKRRRRRKILRDGEYAACLRKQKPGHHTVELEVFYMPTPVQEYPHQRPRFPRTILLVDHESGKLYRDSIAEYDQEIEQVVLGVLEAHVLEFGRPSVILVRNCLVGDMVYDWCKKLDVTLRETERMKQTDSIIGMLYDYVEDEDEEDEEQE